MSLPNYIAKSNELIKKLPSVDSPNSFSELEDISSGINVSRNLNLCFENEDTSVFISYCNVDNRIAIRYIYQIKIQSSGKVRNIDSVMALITQFESEYIYADKISVVPDSGCIYVDIYKFKKE